MGRGIMLIAVLGTVLGTALGTVFQPVSAAVSAEKCPRDQDQVLCWAESKPDGESLEVPLGDWLDLSEEGRRALERGERHAKLDVSVADSISTGEGGTVLLVLADRRTVGPDSVVTALGKATRDTLKDSDACGTRCEKMVGLLTEGIDGQELIDKKLASEPGHDSTLLWLTVGAATTLALLLALFVLAVRRTRTSPAPAATGPDPAPDPHHRAEPRPPPPPRRHRKAGPPRRTATVRTELHPQGYVELDHCLHRAEWTDPGTPPPAPGAPVDVPDPVGAPEHPDVLAAHPHRPGRPTAADHP